MKSRKLEFKTCELVIIMVAICIFSTLTGSLVGYKLQTKDKDKEKEITSVEDAELQNFINEYNDIKEHYYGAFDSKKALSDAISAIIKSLGDVYSGEIDLESSTTDAVKLKGVYSGVGIEIYNDENLNIIINDVFSGSPADRAGVKKGDIITKINGETLKDTLTTTLTNKIKELKNNVFTLELLRDGKYINTSMKSEVIELKSVSHNVIIVNKKKIGYININIFASNTAEQFKKAFNELEELGIDGLIIDVRDNPGGYLDSAARILDLFLNGDKILYKTNDHSIVEAAYSQGQKNYDKKIVILINNNSASASELIALSLKENLSATIIGTKSFGKGTVQEIKEYNNLEYKYTTKLWLSPNGNSINEKGIVPDIVVEKENNNDNQLQSALKQFE